MTEQTNLITVYRSRPYPGEFFSVAYLQEGTPVAYPFTTTPVPDELQDKLVRFDWSTKQWVDISNEATLAKMTDLETQNQTLTLQLVHATLALQEANTKVETLSQQLEQVVLQLGELSVAAETTADTDKEEK